MSKYKIPIIINNSDHYKQLQKKIQKYKLPILKDQPLYEHLYSISSIGNHNLKIEKLKSASYQNNDEVHLHLKSESSYKNSQNSPINKSSANNLSYKNKVNSEEPTNNLTKEDKSSSLSQMTENNHRIRIKRYNSNNCGQLSRYADEQTNLSDLEQQIQQSLLSKVNRNIQQKLPIISQKRQQKTKKYNHSQLWQELFKQLQLHQKTPQKQKKKFKFLTKITQKRSKTELKTKNNIQRYRQCRQIQSQLKNININNSSTYYNPPNRNSSSNVKPKDNSYKKRNTIIHDQSEDNEVIEKAQIVIGNIRNKSKEINPSISFYMNSYEQIKAVNPFFRKINPLGGCILLNIGKLMIVQSGKKLYSQGQPFSTIYILIYGKIILTDKHKSKKKIVLTGQTLGQESLFEYDKPYNQRLKSGQRQYLHKYQAKVLNKSCLLSLQLAKYYKISRQLNKMGYKQLINLIDNLFRINYINKQNSFNSNKIKLNTEQ